MTTPVRTDADWTVEGRVMLGHEIIDVAPNAGDELGRDEETAHQWDRWPDGWPGVLAAVTSSMWVFGSMRLFMDRAAEFAAWRMSQDLVWRKPMATTSRADRFRRSHEHVLHFYRGQWQELYKEPQRDHGQVVTRHVVHRSAIPAGHFGDQGTAQWVDDGSRLATSVIDAPNMWKRDPWHPNEKPGRVLDPLIRYSSSLGGLVLDPFAGGGSTGEAARLAGRRAVLIEADEAYCERIALRLSQTILPIDTTREDMS